MDNTLPIEENVCDYENDITRCHEELSRRYPGLKLRWARIYGSRWAHFLGGDTTVSYYPIKIQINSRLGLYIVNPEMLSPGDLMFINKILKATLAREGD